MKRLRNAAAGLLGLAITFGSAAMGIGIMSRARYDEDQ